MTVSEEECSSTNSRSSFSTSSHFLSKCVLRGSVIVHLLSAHIGISRGKSMGTLIKPKELHDQPVLRPSLSPLSLSTTLITTAASWLGSNLESTTDWEEKKAGKRRNKKKGSVVSGQTHADAVIPSSPVHFVFVNQYHGSGSRLEIG